MIDVIKMYTADLELGMYVSGLDRPWLETPFVLQGFRISTEEDIRDLRRYCQYVYVDIERAAGLRVAAQAAHPASANVAAGDVPHTPTRLLPGCRGLDR